MSKPLSIFILVAVLAVTFQGCAASKSLLARISLDMNKEQVLDKIRDDYLEVVEPADGPLDDPTDLIGDIGANVVGILRAHFDPNMISPRLARPPNLAAYDAYVRGIESYVHTKFPESLRYLQQATELDSLLVQSYLQAAWVYFNTDYDYAAIDSIVRLVERLPLEPTIFERQRIQRLKGIVRGDRPAVMRAAREEARLAPGGYFQFGAGFEAVLSNRPHEALRHLEDLNLDGSMWREWRPLWLFLANAHHMLGDYRRELRVVQRGRQRFSRQMFEWRVLAALGRIRELERRLDEFETNSENFGSLVFLGTAAELLAHGYPDASARIAERVIALYHARSRDGLQGLQAEHRFRLGWAYLLAGDIDTAQASFQELANEDPEQMRYKGLLAVASATLGDRELALSIDVELRGLDRPYLFGKATAWRARIAAALGEHERAITLLRHALSEGLVHHPQGWRLDSFNSVWLDSDPLFHPIRHLPEYQDLMKPAG